LRTLIKYLAETLRKFAHGECKAGAEARRAAQGLEIGQGEKGTAQKLDRNLADTD